MAYPELVGFYNLGKTIGSGGFGKVKVATQIATGEQVAIKIMNKNRLKDDMPRVYKEIEALQSLSHSHICDLYQVIESKDYVFLVMEYCSGGELFDYIIQKEKLEEDEARGFFRQIVAAVAYCHRLGFSHRDIKPENILLDNDQNLKIVDFGLCVRPMKGTQLMTSCGSPNYAAPELLQGLSYFGPQIDVWSLGVLLYALLCGNLPFEAEATDKLYGKILSGQYDEPSWLSLESKLLIRSLLKVDPAQRLSTEQLCEHSWLHQGFNTKVTSLSIGNAEMRRDEDCLRVLSAHLGLTPSQLWTQLIATKTYDYDMATYLLLLVRKKNRLPLRRLRRPSIRPIDDPLGIKSPDAVTSKHGTYVLEKHTTIFSIPDDITATPARGTPARAPCAPARVCRRSAIGTRRASKRIRSPGLGDYEPTPKKINVNHAPISSPPVDAKKEKKTPSSARRTLNRMREILTPRRSLPRDPAQPAVLNSKHMVNVTSTSSADPGHVLQLLQRALEEKGILCTSNGFKIFGKVHRSSLNNLKKMSFELEVCWLPPNVTNSENARSVVAIRRKRLKGDAWMYKSVCEEVLAVAACTVV